MKETEAAGEVICLSRAAGARKKVAGLSHRRPGGLLPEDLRGWEGAEGGVRQCPDCVCVYRAYCRCFSFNVSTVRWLLRKF